MPKIKVNGAEIEYSEEELIDAIDILRQDRVITEFKGMRAQQAEIVAWMNEQKGKKDDGAAGSGDTGDSGTGDSGAIPPVSGDGEGSVGDGSEGTGQPTPPPALSEEEKSEREPKPRKSKWWGDAISYDE